MLKLTIMVDNDTEDRAGYTTDDRPSAVFNLVDLIELNTVNQ